MPRFLATIPVNIGFYNLGTVEAYPTGGSGPTAYGPTSYLGSDPLPQRPGDSINNPMDLGDLTGLFRSLTLSNKHGGNSRIQTTFYQFTLTQRRAASVVQNYSPTSYQSNTNRNTIISFYRVEDGNHRRELPINDAGYVCMQSSIVESDSYTGPDGYQGDYPNAALDPGTYVIVITNDIRYLETTYSFTLNTSINDWRYVIESVDQNIDFGINDRIPSVDYGAITDAALVQSNWGGVTELVSKIIDNALNFSPATEAYDLGSVVIVGGTKATYPYSSTSGLGYTQAGVSP